MLDFNSRALCATCDVILDNRASIVLSGQKSFLDIESFGRRKCENNVVIFVAKMLVKWPLKLMKVPFPDFAHNSVARTFYGGQKDCDKQEVARVNGQGKTKGMG